MNIAVLHGVLSSDPKSRTLPSGDRLLTYEVTTDIGDGVASVPVAWLNPGRPPAVESGASVIVVGHVRRRFFRAGGAAASRTEVVATVVVKPDSRRVDGLLETAAAALRSAADPQRSTPPAA